MKKLTLAVLLSIFVFGACKKTKEPDNPILDASKWKFEKLTEKKELFLNNDSTKGGMKISLEFNYPVEYKNDSILKSIQSAFVMVFAGEEYKNATPKDAFDKFLKAIISDGLEMGKEAAEDGPDFSYYLKNITTSVFDTTSMTITAKTYYEDYTGGAHGSHQTSYYNIDTQTGEILKEKDLFKSGSDEPLKKLVQEAVDDTIKSGNSITVLDPEAVKPNGNFYFDDKGLVYVFNEYEIAPYSDGLIEIRIPYNKLRDLFAHKYEELIAIKTKTE